MRGDYPNFSTTERVYKLKRTPSIRKPGAQNPLFATPQLLRYHGERIIRKGLFDLLACHSMPRDVPEIGIVPVEFRQWATRACV
jgi:hypothetical protein